MKKLVYCLIGVLLAVGFSSCGEISVDPDFDEDLLYGKWQEGSVYERYYETAIDFVLPSGDTVQANGTTWDEGDDISEDEAQPFNWTLTGSTLKHVHVGTFTEVPKMYTVTKLTSDELTYNDDYGTTHYFTRAD